MVGTLQTALTATFGLGKSFLRGETSELEAGLPVEGRYDKNGWHFFNVTEFGRSALYAVKNAAVLDRAMGVATADPKADAKAEIKRLMALHGIAASEL